MPAQAVPMTEFAPARRDHRSSPHPASVRRPRLPPSYPGRGRRAGDWGDLYLLQRLPAHTGPATHADRILQWWQVNAVKAGVIVAGAWCLMVNAWPLWNAIAGLS
jgi:hypothetical protein